ncbi:hypothetical protein KKF91_19655, partial [Myxococcota bacterium]|nr:hypothetical protein [Myxococcota bacterium]
MSHWPDPKLERLLDLERASLDDPPEGVEERVFERLTRSIAAGAALTVAASEAASAATGGVTGGTAAAVTTATGKGGALLLGLSGAPKALGLAALLGLGGGVAIWRTTAEPSDAPEIAARALVAPHAALDAGLNVGAAPLIDAG